MSKYDVDQVRKRLHEKQGNRFKDPNEFRPPVAPEGETLKYRFFVLPPLQEGDTCADGKASRSMDVFYVQNGSHFVNNRKHECPRVHDEIDCPLCQVGFDQMGETDDKARRSDIARSWLPRTQYAVNIYFPKDGVNPDDVAGKVLWMNASKQVYDLWEACIYNDDAGDPSDPQPYGVFYDENSAYYFQLQIKKKNKWNDYSASKFLASSGKRPIATKDGKAIPSRIQEILDQRHDLYAKFPQRDVEALAKLAQQLQSGEPPAEESGFDVDESAKTESVKKPATKAPAKAPAAAKAPAKAPAKPAAAPKKEPEVVEEDLTGLGEDVASEEGAATDEVPAETAAPEAEDKPASTEDAVEDSELQGLLDEIDKT